MHARIMYIESNGENGISGPARIGRVTFSKSGRSIYYQGRPFMKAEGFKSNFIDAETGEEYSPGARNGAATGCIQIH